MDLRDKILFEPPEVGGVLSLTGLPGGSSKIYDRSPYGNIGAITGATWVRLPSGLWCLSFDGVDDEVNCGTDASLDSPDLTVEFWYCPSSYPTTGMPDPMCKEDYTNNLGWRMYIPSWANAGKRVRWRLYDGSGSKEIATSDLVLDTWYHLVGTYQASTKGMEFFQNADSSGTDTLANSFSPATAQPLYIGYRQTHGLIALPRVYNRVLSAIDIQGHFNREKHLFAVW